MAKMIPISITQLSSVFILPPELPTPLHPNCHCPRIRRYLSFLFWVGATVFHFPSSNLAPFLVYHLYYYQSGL